MFDVLAYPMKYILGEDYSVTMLLEKMETQVCYFLASLLDASKAGLYNYLCKSLLGRDGKTCRGGKAIGETDDLSCKVKTSQEIAEATKATIETIFKLGRVRQRKVPKTVKLMLSSAFSLLSLSSSPIYISYMTFEKSKQNYITGG